MALISRLRNLLAAFIAVSCAQVLLSLYWGGGIRSCNSYLINRAIRRDAKGDVLRMVSTTPERLVKDVDAKLPSTSSSSSSSSSFGRPHTESSKAKISAANKGKTPWNAGKKHSEETRLRIAEKTRAAFVRRKEAEAMALGLTLEEYENSKVAAKVETQRRKLKGGLSQEGRQRISDSLKRRWEDPEYRRRYTASCHGKRNHSAITKARISDAIKLKWQDQGYRSKISVAPSPEVRARISATLKAKWEDPGFRNRMMSSISSRSDTWRVLISEKIRKKWEDPSYRQAVEDGIKNSNRTWTYTGTRREAKSKPKRLTMDESRQRRLIAKQERTERDQARRESMRAAKRAARQDPLSGGESIKALLGGELWFEEKMRRTKRGETLMEDEALERALRTEWGGQEEEDGGEEECPDNFLSAAELQAMQVENDDDDDDDDDDIYSWDGDDEDLIEVYDENGELVGRYTEAEFERLERSKP